MFQGPLAGRAAPFLSKAKGARSSTASSERLMPLPWPTVDKYSSSGSLLAAVVTTAVLTASEAAAASGLASPASATVAPKGCAVAEKAVRWAPGVGLGGGTQRQKACPFGMREKPRTKP